MPEKLEQPYPYAFNNPVSVTDPTGLYGVKQCVKETWKELKRCWSCLGAPAQALCGLCWSGLLARCAAGCIGAGPGWPACMPLCLADHAVGCSVFCGVTLGLAAIVCADYAAAYFVGCMSVVIGV